MSEKKKFKYLITKVTRGIRPFPIQFGRTHMIELCYFEKSGGLALLHHDVIAGAIRVFDQYCKRVPDASDEDCNDTPNHRELIQDGYYCQGRETDVVWTSWEDGHWLTRVVGILAKFDLECSLLPQNCMSEIWIGDISEAFGDEDFLSIVGRMWERLQEEHEPCRSVSFVMPTKFGMPDTTTSPQLEASDEK